jgi:hypothetical protein
MQEIGMTFVTVFAGGIAIQRTSWAIWFWQLLSCFGSIFFVYFMMPETGGKVRRIPRLQHLQR